MSDTDRQAGRSDDGDTTKRDALNQPNDASGSTAQHADKKPNEHSHGGTGRSGDTGGSGDTEHSGDAGKGGNTDQAEKHGGAPQ